jgi:hypothetical protein
MNSSKPLFDQSSASWLGSKVWQTAVAIIYMYVISLFFVCLLLPADLPDQGTYRLFVRAITQYVEPIDRLARQAVYPDLVRGFFSIAWLCLILTVPVAFFYSPKELVITPKTKKEKIVIYIFLPIACWIAISSLFFLPNPSNRIGSAGLFYSFLSDGRLGLAVVGALIFGVAAFSLLIFLHIVRALFFYRT